MISCTDYLPIVPYRTLPNSHITCTKYKQCTCENFCDWCVNIRTWEECKDAQENLKQIYNGSFASSIFINATGQGGDLPKGCVSDTLGQKHYFYWNPEGGAISHDPNIEQVCTT